MSKKKIVIPGDWFTNEHDNRVFVMAVAEGWCMVREGNKKPYVLPAEFVLATFNP